MKLIQAVNKITSIPVTVLVGGSKAVLAKRLKDFFAAQRKNKMLGM